MRPLIKRSLFGLVGAGLVLGLTACGHTPFGGDRGDRGEGRAHHMGMGHGQHSEADMQKHREKMLERATSELSLDAAQKAKLVTLMDTVQAKRAAMVAAKGDPKAQDGRPGPGGMVPRADMQALVKGDKFDRAGAQALVDQKAGAMRAAAPDVITAMGDFYDSLKPEQQAKVRAFMERGPMGRGMMGGHRG
jgi:Spy/CpxP family protein refolding chaperone